MADPGEQDEGKRADEDVESDPRVRDPRASEHTAGEEHAAENRENESPG